MSAPLMVRIVIYGRGLAALLLSTLMLTIIRLAGIEALVLPSILLFVLVQPALLRAWESYQFRSAELREGKVVAAIGLGKWVILCLAVHVVMESEGYRFLFALLH